MKTEGKTYGLFPMFVDLSDKKILVAGAGRIAARRIGTLTAFATDITVVAPDADPRVDAMEAEGLLTRIRRTYQREDLDGADLVIAATDDSAVNDGIAAACNSLGIPVNVISDQKKCDFHFPGIVKRENLVIGINAGGKDHCLARKTREQIEEMMGGNRDDST